MFILLLTGEKVRLNCSVDGQVAYRSIFRRRPLASKFPALLRLANISISTAFVDRTWDGYVDYSFCSLLVLFSISTLCETTVKNQATARNSKHSFFSGHWCVHFGQANTVSLVNSSDHGRSKFFHFVKSIARTLSRSEGIKSWTDRKEKHCSLLCCQAQSRTRRRTVSINIVFDHDLPMGQPRQMKKSATQAHAFKHMWLPSSHRTSIGTLHRDRTSPKARVWNSNSM